MTAPILSLSLPLYRSIHLTKHLSFCPSTSLLLSTPLWFWRGFYTSSSLWALVLFYRSIRHSTPPPYFPISLSLYPSLYTHPSVRQSSPLYCSVKAISLSLPISLYHSLSVSLSLSLSRGLSGSIYVCVWVCVCVCVCALQWDSVPERFSPGLPAPRTLRPRTAPPAVREW